MDLGALCATLQAATSHVPEERKAAEQQLAQSLFAPGFLWALLQVVARSDVDMGVRQMASIHFKNVTARHWKIKSEDAPTFSQEDRAAVRSHILEAVAMSPPQIRKQLSECLKSIVNSDFPERWPTLLALAMESIGTGDEKRMYGGLMAIRVLTRKYEFKDEEERQPVSAVVETAFPALLSVLKHLIALKSPSLEVADFIKLILKTFWSACYLKIPPVLRQGGLFLEWMGCFHALLLEPVPTEGQPSDPEMLKAWPWWKVKKWLLHILNRLFNRFADPARAKGADEKAFAELFQDQCAGSILEANVAMLSQLRTGTPIPERVTNLALHYLTYCIPRKKMYALLKPHLPLLLSDITFPLLCFGDADSQLWNEDPNEYVRKGYDFFEDMYSSRKGAIDFVAELVTKKSKEHLDTYIANIVQIFNSFAATPPGQTPPYREKDGALLVVGALHEKLKSTSRYAGQLEAMLTQHVFPEFSSPMGHLRAKAAWVAGEYADIPFTNRAHFNLAFHSVVGLLSDPELPVRVDAVVALRSFIEASADDLELLRPLIPQLLNDFFRLMNEVENEDLVLTLEVLVENFGEEMAPYALGLVTNLSASFWKCMKLDESAESQLQRLEGGEDDDDDDMGPLAAAGCLRAISTILSSVSSIPQLFPQMEPCLVPILHRMMSTEGEDVIEEVLEIATLLTFVSPTISPQMWALWPKMIHCLNDFAIDFFDSMLGPFDNFISRGTDHFLTCPEPNYPQSLFQLVSHLLQDEKMGEQDITAAPKLLSSVLQNCRGRVDHWVEPYVLLALQRLAKTEYKYLKDLLLLVVADALFYNNQLTMSILQKHNMAAGFFQGWMEMLSARKKSGKMLHFKREYDKKVCILSLASVLSLPEASLPPELAQGQQQMLQVLLKLLLAYKEQVIENKRLEEDDEDEDDDDDDDEWVEAEEGEELEEEEEEEETTTTSNKKLEKRAQEIFKALEQDEDEEDDDDDYDWFMDDEEAETPIDPIDPFIYFSDAMAVLQQTEAQRFQALFGTLDFSHQAMVHDVTKQTEERRKEAATKAAEELAKANQQGVQIPGLPLSRLAPEG